MAAIASSRVETLIKVRSVLSPARSLQLADGTRNAVAPAFSAPAIFSWMPPIAPTSPVGVIVPVPAMCLPSSSGPGVILS